MFRTIAVSMMTLVAATLVGCGEAPMVSAPMAPVAAQAVKAPSTVTYAPVIIQQMAKFDTNKDSVLSQAEYVNGHFAELRFIKAPTATETANLKAGFAKDFAKLDANRDNKLTVAEFAHDFQ